MNKLTIKQGEGRWLRFVVTRDGSALDLSASTLHFVLKRAYTDTSYALTRGDVYFDKTDAADGIVRLNLSTTITAGLSTGKYLGELLVVIASGVEEYKSDAMEIMVQPSLIS